MIYKWGTIKNPCRYQLKINLEVKTYYYTNRLVIMKKLIVNSRGKNFRLHLWFLVSSSTVS